MKSSPHSLHLEKAHTQRQRPTATKNKFEQINVCVCVYIYIYINLTEREGKKGGREEEKEFQGLELRKLRTLYIFIFRNYWPTKGNSWMT